MATATKDFEPIVLPRSDLVVPPPEPMRLYELRVLDGCPKQSITVGAARATFSKFAGNPALNEAGDLVGRLEYPRQMLSEREVGLIKESIAKRVVLLDAGNATNIYDVGHAALRGQPPHKVRPLAEFVSLVPISDAAAGPEPEPVSMAGRKTKAAEPVA